ncbi:MAG: protein kinase [Phycisphaerales bacterium]|nr:protein kinase [Phycisphaerales bacterium]
MNPPQTSPSREQSDSPSNTGSRTGASRARAVRTVIADCMARRASGQAVSDAAIIAAHPDLMPELEQELQLLSLIERARDRAAADPGSHRPAAVSDASTVGSRTGTASDVALDDAGFPPGYSPVREVFRGGQGVVFEAVQHATGRRVAVKVRHEPLAPGSSSFERFEREVEILAQLDHPNIVKVLDSGTYLSHPFYVMDYVEGRPLDEHLASAQASDVRARLQLFEKIAAAVSAAHIRGVIHRDLKPANILVDSTGQPKLVDFGLARLTHLAGSLADVGSDSSRTLAGQFLGSVPWASPEQADGDPAKIDVRSDVYSLGVVLFQMLTGRMPYTLPPGDQARNPRGLRLALDVIRTEPPLRASSLRRDIDPDIDTILFKCLAKEPERRYQSAAELADDLRRHLEYRPIVARPPTLSYQFKRFVRRNRVVVLGASTVALALVAGAVATLVQLSRAREAEALATVRAAEAEHHSYTANIFGAHMALKAGDGPSVQARLEAAPPGERGWEWRYLMAQTDQAMSELETPEPVGFVRPLGRTGVVVGSCRSGTLRGWDIRSGRQVWEAPSIEGTVNMCVSADGRRVVTLDNQELAVHNGGSGSLIKRWHVADQQTLGSAWLTADGSRLVAGGREQWGIRIFETDTGRELVASGPLESSAHSVAFTPDGRLVLSIESPRLVVRSAADLSIVRTIELEPRRFKSAARVYTSPDGRTAAVSRIENIMLFDIASGARAGELRGHTQFVNDLVFGPDGASIVTCSTDATVREWDTASLTCKRILMGHRELVYRVCIEPATGRIISTAPEEPRPMVWSASSGLACLSPDLPPTASVLGLAARDRGVICTIDAQAVMARVTLDGTTLTPIGEGMKLLPRQAIADRTGRFVAFIDTGGAGHVYQTADGVQSGAFVPPTDRAMRALSPDGERLIFTLPDRARDEDAVSQPDGASLDVVETRTGRARSIQMPDDRYDFMTFGNDGRTVFALGPETDLVTWSIEDGAPPRVLVRSDEHHRIFSLNVDPSGPRVVIGDSTGAIRIVEADTGRVVRSLGGPPAPPVFSLAFTPDGRRLAAGIGDGTIRFFDAQTGEELLTLRGIDLFADMLAFTDDGATLFGRSHGRRAFLWNGAASPRSPAAP